MANTTEVPVQTTPTPLPATTATTRTSVLVENLGSEDIWVSHSVDQLASGEGHRVASNTAREFGGAPLWAVVTSTPQGGGAGDTTIVTEYP